MSCERGPRRGDDNAFSAVLGAMVLLGIGLIAFTTYQTTLAPAFEANSEAEQMQTVADRLGRWVSAVGLADADDGARATSAHLPMQAASPPMAGSPSSSTLSFHPSSSQVNLSASTLSVTHLNGSAVGGTGEAWQPVEASSVEDIASVESLRLRIQEVDNARTGESITLTVSDEAGEELGQLTLSIVDPSGDGRGGGQGFEVVVTVQDADGSTLFDQPILISSTTHDSHSEPISPYWVNVLNADYRFDRVLASAQPPYRLQLEPDGLEADYTIEYDRLDASRDGTDGSLLIDGYERSMPSGRLVFEGRSDEADDQQLTVEHGAVIRSQEDGAVFVRSPSFSATRIGHTVHIGFTWPTLTGSPDARSTSSTLGIHASPVDDYAVRGRAPNLAINVTTEHPDLWTSFFEDSLQQAGLTSGKGFTTASGAGWARVDVWGLLDPDPSSDRFDVNVDLRSLEAGLRIGN